MLPVTICCSILAVGVPAIQPDGWVPRTVDPRDYGHLETIAEADVNLTVYNPSTETRGPAQSFVMGHPGGWPEGEYSRIHWLLTNPKVGTYGPLRVDFDWPTDYVAIDYYDSVLVNLACYSDEGELLYEQNKEDRDAYLFPGFIEYQSEHADIAYILFGGSQRTAYALGLHFNGPYAPGTRPGDMDGSRVLDAFDVDDFEVAVSRQSEYVATHPGLDPIILGDLDGNGFLDAFDIDDFEALLAGGGAVVPEPGVLGLLLGLAGAMVRGRRHRWTDFNCGSVSPLNPRSPQGASIDRLSSLECGHDRNQKTD